MMLGMLGMLELSNEVGVRRSRSQEQIKAIFSSYTTLHYLPARYESTDIPPKVGAEYLITIFKVSDPGSGIAAGDKSVF